MNGDSDTGWGQFHRIPVPERGVADLVRSCRTGELNFSLLFHHYLPQIEKNARGREKADLLALLDRAFPEYLRCLARSKPEGEEAGLLEAVRDQSLRSVLETARGGATLVSLKLQERLALGLGTASAFDTGLRLHHLLGVPYLPSSSLKGLARATALRRIAEELGVPYSRSKPPVGKTPVQLLDLLLAWQPPRKEDPAEAQKKARDTLDGLLKEIQGKIQGESWLLCYRAREWESAVVDWQNAEAQGLNPTLAPFRQAFGHQAARGGVVFSDAYPVDLRRLEPDLINPHYGEYYRNPANPPADWGDPVPAFFLTVPAGTTFRFVLGSVEVGRPGAIDGAALRRQVLGWLEEGLALWGIGAKRAVGYGAGTAREEPVPPTNL